MVARLFAIEVGIKGKPPAERPVARRAKATPILAELRAFLNATMEKVSGKRSLAGAFRYATSRWTGLIRYVGDGRIEMSNNAAERAITALALGRKNYLFAGTDEGGRRAAILYTLIETARLNEVDPEARLGDVISRTGEHPNTESTNCSLEMERSRFAGDRRIVARGRHVALTFNQPRIDSGIAM